MYKLFIDGTFFAPAQDKRELKEKMDKAVLQGYDPADFQVFARKAHVTYARGESSLIID